MSSGALLPERIVRIAFAIAAAVVAVMGIVLPLGGFFEPALLPFLLALTAYCVGDAIATYIQGKRAGVDFWRGRGHPLR